MAGASVNSFWDEGIADLPDHRAAIGGLKEVKCQTLGAQTSGDGESDLQTPQVNLVSVVNKNATARSSEVIGTV